MSEYAEHKFDAPLSGQALLNLMRKHKVKLSDISITARHVQYFEDWEEDHIIVRFRLPPPPKNATVAGLATTTED